MADARPWILAETTWTTVRDTKYEIAVLPWGATEAHNFHLPYCTDLIQAERLASESARLAWERGARVAVLPGIAFGVNTGQLDIPFCINMPPSTQAVVLRDVVQSVERAGARKLVVFNAHGGNDFKQMLRELQPATKVFLCTLNWWQVVPPAPYFDEPGDHAGELETAVMQVLTPDLVRPLSEAGSGKERKFRIAALRERWVWAQREWTKITADTGVGDPKAATREKGERYVAAVTEKVAGFLVDLAKADPSSLYE